eukprot:TRINITY_DN6684_c0_g1_i2.p1 TRINITY_DN6684_c0_g1~~TRINITY_DN6684_c0_g1_i2.p1  ORF type:complete len:457 (+),score=107.46 TRINITY_DN6684_c0_g1_i2:70-1440(+)
MAAMAPSLYVATEIAGMHAELLQLQQASISERERHAREKAELERDLRWALSRLPEDGAAGAVLTNADTVALLEQMEKDMRHDRNRVEEMKKQVAHEQLAHAAELEAMHHERAALLAELHDLKRVTSPVRMRNRPEQINHPVEQEVLFELDFTHKELQRVTTTHRQLMAEYKTLAFDHAAAEKEIERLRKWVQLPRPSSLPVSPPSVRRPQPEPEPEPEPEPDPESEEEEEEVDPLAMLDSDKEAMDKAMRAMLHRAFKQALMSWGFYMEVVRREAAVRRCVGHWGHRHLSLSWNSWQFHNQMVAVASGVAYWVRSHQARFWGRLEDTQADSEYKVQLHDTAMHFYRIRNQFRALTQFRRYNFGRNARIEARGGDSHSPRPAARGEEGYTSKESSPRSSSAAHNRPAVVSPRPKHRSSEPEVSPRGKEAALQLSRRSPPPPRSRSLKASKPLSLIHI